MNLFEKIKATKEIFKQIVSVSDPGYVFVAWTGGKDSTVTLRLWKQFLEEKRYNGKLRAINLDTGLKFPEITKFRDALAADWAIDLHAVSPDIEIKNYPIAEDKVKCCNDLKISPLRKSIQVLKVNALVTGIRRDENPSRIKREFIETKHNPSYIQANPILHWTEMDIWSFIIQENMPYCELYDQGYTSLGCMPCTTRPSGQGERSGRDRDKENSLDKLRSLGYF